MVATSTKNQSFWLKSLPYYQIVMQHLTHINNISVLFVVDPFESANNMFVDGIENKYLLVLNLNELDFQSTTTRQQRDTVDNFGPGGFFPDFIFVHLVAILLLIVIFKAKCLFFYARI